MLASRVFQYIIAHDSAHFQAHFSLAFLYLASTPELVPQAEQLLLKAQALARPKTVPGVERGLFFTCLYQGKKAEALVHLERYVQLCPEDSEAVTLLERQRRGEALEFVYKPIDGAFIKGNT